VAKKPRTPDPPRRVQAPKQRHAPRQRLGGDRARMILYGAAGAVVVAVAVVLIVVLAGSKSGKAAGSDTKVRTAMTAAGCTFTSKPVLPPKDKKNFHNDAPTPTTKVKWSTFPPSGGGHYALWAVWNFYIDPVPPAQVVHNEEHGGVIIWWGPKVSEATVSKLRSFYLDDPNSMLGTPIAGLGNKIALTAWVGDPSRYYKNGYYGIGKLAICPRYDESAFKTFRDAYRGHGPEGIPTSANNPGSGPNG
jgi:Protein of unknown function (DUF3105)